MARKKIHFRNLDKPSGGSTREPIVSHDPVEPPTTPPKNIAKFIWLAAILFMFFSCTALINKNSSNSGVRVANSSANIVPAPAPIKIKRPSPERAAPAKSAESSQEEIIAGLLKHPQKKNRDNEYRYGEMLLEGTNIAKNIDKGLSLLKQSAEHGSTNAQKLLGSLYYKGNFVTKNYVEAAKYYRMAAEGGVTEAQYFYGMMLINGIGTEKDFEAGLMHTNKAAKNGHADAKTFIKEYDEEFKNDR